MPSRSVLGALVRVVGLSRGPPWACAVTDASLRGRCQSNLSGPKPLAALLDLGAALSRPRSLALRPHPVSGLLQKRCPPDPGRPSAVRASQARGRRSAPTEVGALNVARVLLLGLLRVYSHPRRGFGERRPAAPSCSALVVSHHLDGLLRAGSAGLLHPAAGSGVRRVSARSERGVCTLRLGRSCPRDAFRTLRSLHSPTAAPCHHGRCPLGVEHLRSTPDAPRTTLGPAPKSGRAPLGRAFAPALPPAPVPTGPADGADGRGGRRAPSGAPRRPGRTAVGRIPGDPTCRARHLWRASDPFRLVAPRRPRGDGAPVSPEGAGARAPEGTPLGGPRRPGRAGARPPEPGGAMASRPLGRQGRSPGWRPARRPTPTPSRGVFGAPHRWGARGEPRARAGAPRWGRRAAAATEVAHPARRHGTARSRGPPHGRSRGTAAGEPAATTAPSRSSHRPAPRSGWKPGGPSRTRHLERPGSRNLVALRPGADAQVCGPKAARPRRPGTGATVARAGPEAHARRAATRRSDPPVPTRRGARGRGPVVVGRRERRTGSSDPPARTPLGSRAPGPARAPVEVPQVSRRRRAASRSPMVGSSTSTTPRRGLTAARSGGRLPRAAGSRRSAEALPLGAARFDPEPRYLARSRAPLRRPYRGAAQVDDPPGRLARADACPTRARGRSRDALVRFVARSGEPPPPKWRRTPRDRLSLDRRPVAGCRGRAARRSPVSLTGHRSEPSPSRPCSVDESESRGDVATTADPVLPWALSSFEGFPDLPPHAGARDPPLSRAGLSGGPVGPCHPGLATRGPRSATGRQGDHPPWSF